MIWFRQNGFLGAFLVALGVGTLGSLLFLWMAKSGFTEASGQFDENASELNRLQRLAVFPNVTNLRKMKTQADDYAAELNKAKEQLKKPVLPIPVLAPNEFQARLRQTMAAVAEKARANRVKLPGNFYLGFEEFAAALPDTAAAPLLGQELAQAELLVNALIDARVDGITAFKRVTAAEPRGAATLSPTPAPAAGPRKPPGGAAAAAPLIERNVVDLTFVSNPGSARRALNQITTAGEQFYVLRTLHVLNEKDKGPPREGEPATADAPAPSAPSAAPAASLAAGKTALHFVVGTERIQTSARVEMLRFNF
ncbi:MAG: hypothetical protein H0T11_01510 [Chthoniobacterales bacterium]|nr:hypothetical protein [Chthoniobacterales bacterium]